MKTALLTMGLATALLAALVTATLRFPSRASALPNSFDRIVIPVGKQPGPIAIADINHDGKPDIIVGNMDDGTV
ncbi:MAG: FG-GAP repeat protein, partial [Candidatus Acidiferrales bacterium]